jgi:hypothetical protein
MTGVDALGKRLAKGFDRIASMQRPEGWRCAERTLACLIDRMAPRAMRSRIGMAALLGC